MIIAHFFIRKKGGKQYLYVETTSSVGLEQPEPAAKPLIEVDGKCNRREWIRKAYYAFTANHPGLVLSETMDNGLRLESDHPSFDLVFRPKLKPGPKPGSRRRARDPAGEAP